MLEDWHSLGQNYDQTLMAWHKKFVKNWDKIKELYDERFYRIRVSYGQSGIAVMVIHSNGIEPGTTEIAEAVSGEVHIFYLPCGM